MSVVNDTTQPIAPVDASGVPAPRFFGTLVGMLVRPTATIRGLTHPDAWVGAAVLLIVGYTIYLLPMGWITAKWQALAADEMLKSFPAGSTRARGMEWILWYFAAMPYLQLGGQLVGVPFTVFCSWIARVGFVYGVARLLGGTMPPLHRVVSFTGWAWAPLFLQYTLIGILLWASPAFAQILVPLPDSVTADAMGGYAARLWRAAIPYVTPFVFWNLILCAYGIEENFKLPRWKALLAVSILAVLQIGLVLASLLFTSLVTGAMPATAPPPPAGNAPAGG